MKELVIIFPGRFQPFGAHHKAVYDFLELKFGSGRVFLTSSNKVNTTDCPLNFEQKQKIAIHRGVPSNKFIYAASPYKPDELRSYFNPTSSVLIFVLGEKDKDRFSFLKKDGTPSYFQPYTDDINSLDSFDKHAYVFIAPKIDLLLNEKELSGTALRNHLRNASQEEFEKQLGFFDLEIFKIFKQLDTEGDNEILKPYPVENPRLGYYKQYLTNLIPSNFTIEIVDGKIVISISEELNEVIMKLKGGKYRVYSRKLTKGDDGEMHRRNMGTYSSKKDALAREEQIKDFMANKYEEEQALLQKQSPKKKIQKENKVLEKYKGLVDSTFWKSIFDQITND